MDSQALSKEAATKTPNLYLYRVRKMEHSMVYPKSTCLSSPCTRSSVWKGTLVVLAVQSHSHTGSEDKGGAKVPFSGKSKPHRSQSLSKVTFLRIVKGHLLLRFLLPPSFHEHSVLSSQCFYSLWVLLLSFPLFLHQLPHVAPV